MACGGHAAIRSASDTVSLTTCSSSTTRLNSPIRAASSRLDAGSRILKADDTFVVLDRFGDIAPGGTGELGLYHRGTRFLSRFALRLDGGRPFLLSSEVREDDAVFVANLTNPDFVHNGESLVRGSIHLVRECRLGPSMMDIPLTVSVVYASGAVEDHLVKVSEATTTVDLPATAPVKTVELNRDDQALVVVERGTPPRTRSGSESGGNRAALRD